MIKNYVDEIPPADGRKYLIETEGTDSTITDVTQYEQEGSIFGASDIQGVCIMEVTHSKTGTTHNLTCENLRAENIKFRATAQFNTDDAVYVNGTRFSARFQNGTFGGHGAFVKDAWVCANLDYTNGIITILQPGGVIVVPQFTVQKDFVDWLLSFPIGTHTLSLNNTTTAELIQLPSDRYVLTFYRDNSVMANFLIAYRDNDQLEYRWNFTDSNPYNINWHLLDNDFIVLNAEDATDFYNFLMSLPDRQKTTFSVAASIAASLGIVNSISFITVYKYGNTRISVEAISPYVLGAVWYGSVYNSTWSGFTKYQLPLAT